MIRFLILLTGIIACFSIPAFAQIYQYTDEDGVVRFTDDIMKVPENLREDVKQYKEIQESSGNQTESSKPKIPVQKRTAPFLKKPDKPGKTDENLKEIKKQVDRQKKDLKEEYQALMEEKKQIAENTRKWQIWYNTRRRKSVARGKLKELELQQAEWEEKYKAYEDKKKELQGRLKQLKNPSKAKKADPAKQ